MEYIPLQRVHAATGSERRVHISDITILGVHTATGRIGYTYFHDREFLLLHVLHIVVGGEKKFSS